MADFGRDDPREMPAHLLCFAKIPADRQVIDSPAPAGHNHGS